MRIVLIEDEFHAMERLKLLIKKVRPSFEIIAELDSVEDAIHWFNTNPQPDLLFSDIQLADGLSFEILYQIPVKVPVIFTTAYDKYALDAFKANSIDYLLKPVDESKISDAIAKLESYQSVGKGNMDTEKVKLLMELMKPTPTYRKQFLVKQHQHQVAVKVSEAAYFISEDGLTFLFDQSGNRWIIDQSLEVLEKELSPEVFFRINRQQIVCKYSVSKVHAYFNHRCKLELTGLQHPDLIVARTRAKAFKSWMDT